MSYEALLEALALAYDRDGVVLTREAERLGMTRHELEGLRRAAAGPLPRGAIAVGPVRDELRTAARAAQLLVPTGVLSHRTALRLHGLEGLPYWSPAEPTQLTCSTKRHQRRGLRLSFDSLRPDEVSELDGLIVTSPARSLSDTAELLHRGAWVCLADSGLKQKLLTVDDLNRWGARLPGGRQQWLRLVDGRSESPSETRVRLRLTDAGLPPDDLQIVVRDGSGIAVARLDLGYYRNGRQVGLEVDSGWHDQVKALYRDREKHNALRDLGWDVRQVTAWDVSNRPTYIVHQVRNALGLR